jgi:CheY-like chemotaxis protein
MAEALKREGFSVVGLFDNGESALDFMKGWPKRPDAPGSSPTTSTSWFTDIEMPKMSGLTLAKSVREMGLGSIR